MTAAALITEILSMLRNQLYGDRPVAEYFRDERHLKGAIARYGHACHDRGWEFDAEFIRLELVRIVQVVKRQKISGYLPVYLHEAVDRHVREHAEELSAHAKELRTVSAKALGKMRTVPELPPAPKATEILALFYADLKRQKPARKPKPVEKVKQGGASVGE